MVYRDTTTNDLGVCYPDSTSWPSQYTLRHFNYCPDCGRRSPQHWNYCEECGRYLFEKIENYQVTWTTTYTANDDSTYWLQDNSVIV